MSSDFEWDDTKDEINIKKHGISFQKAQKAFLDKDRLIYKDVDHSTKQEKRYYCIGRIGENICTVRFIYKNKKIRIFGAGYWRKERRFYEKEKIKK